MSYTDPSNRPIDRTIPFSAGSSNGDTHLSTVDNPVETAKLLSELLKEYAGNLRSVGDDLHTAKRTTIMIRCAIVVVVSIIALIGLVCISFKDVSPFLITWLYVFAAMGGIVTAMTIITANRSGVLGSTRALHRSAAISVHHLSRLIRTTSQFKEHAVLDMARHLELDLRLAEAEATIDLYSDVIQKPLSL